MTEGGADLRVVTEIAGDASCNLSHLIVRGWHLVVVRGEMGSSSVPTLQRVLDGALADGGKMIVDLARCSAITAECVEALFTANKTLRKTGGEFMLVVDGVAVLQAIRAAGFAGRFEIHRYVGDIVGAVPGLDEGGRGRRRDMVIRPAVQ
jgi:anti-anti-sigma factor